MDLGRDWQRTGPRNGMAVVAPFGSFLEFRDIPVQLCALEFVPLRLLFKIACARSSLNIKIKFMSSCMAIQAGLACVVATGGATAQACAFHSAFFDVNE